MAHTFEKIQPQCPSELWYFKHGFLLVLFFISLVPLVLYYSEALIKQTDLIHNIPAQRLLPIAKGDVQSNISKTDAGTIKSQCIVVQNSPQNVCGVNYLFSDNNLSNGLQDSSMSEHRTGVIYDVASYDEVHLHVNSDVPVQPHSLRLQLNSHDPSYSDGFSEADLKPHGSTYDAEPGEHVFVKPVSAFEVESWWLYMRRLSMGLSGSDLDKVAGFSLVHNGLSDEGHYYFEIKALYLTKNRVSFSFAMTFIIAMLTIIIILLLLRQRQILNVQIEYDALTGLYNRTGMTKFVTRHMVQNAKPTPLSVMFCDIDDFKQINDKFGHSYGDEILQRFAAILNDSFTTIVPQNTPAISFRLSGDEFAVLIFTEDYQVVKSLASHLVKSCESDLQTSKGARRIQSSVGFTYGRIASADISVLMKQADLAMYNSKKAGKGQSWGFDPGQVVAIAD